jgi:hypothetical protein
MTPASKRACAILAFAGSIALATATATAAAPETATAQEDPCARFSWNIEREHALFATSPQALTAGRDAASGAQLVIDQLYELQLAPQSQTSMVLPPGKKSAPEGAYAGLARLRIQQTGSYRISLDQPAWIDLADEGRMIDSADFQGRPGCAAPHKIVQYSLPGGHELVLQLSAALAPRIRITITRVP